MTSYKNIDEAYRDLAVRMSAVARRHLYNKDYAIDATHDAFTKASENAKKKPGNRVSGFILMRELMRACRRINKKGSVEVPTDFSSGPGFADRSERE